MSNNIVYWKMRNGELISVDDMDINHLRNTLKMIIRNSQKQVIKPTPKFKLEGDIANDFNDNHPATEDDIDDAEGDFYNNHYYDFKR